MTREAATESRPREEATRLADQLAAEKAARRAAEERIRELEAELAWLKARLNPPSC